MQLPGEHQAMPKLFQQQRLQYLQHVANLDWDNQILARRFQGTHMYQVSSQEIRLTEGQRYMGKLAEFSIHCNDYQECLKFIQYFATQFSHFQDNLNVQFIRRQQELKNTVRSKVVMEIVNIYVSNTSKILRKVTHYSQILNEVLADAEAKSNTMLQLKQLSETQISHSRHLLTSLKQEIYNKKSQIKLLARELQAKHSEAFILQLKNKPAIHKLPTQTQLIQWKIGFLNHSILQLQAQLLHQNQLYQTNSLLNIQKFDMLLLQLFDLKFRALFKTQLQDQLSIDYQHPDQHQQFPPQLHHQYPHILHSPPHTPKQTLPK